MQHRDADATFAYFYAQGTERRAYEAMGAHPVYRNGRQGYSFAVFAPQAQRVSVVGDFNGWSTGASPMERVSPSSGVWTGFVPGAIAGQRYKYAVLGADGVMRLKTDPYAFSTELRSRTAGILTDGKPFLWTDEVWRDSHRLPKNGPVHIYEVHLFSWCQVCTPESGIDLDREGERLARYARDIHYTHIELLPVMEHPLDDSWGYQVTGFFAPTGRLGTPESLKNFVNTCHRMGIGVLLDWVPGHFCKDGHGLNDFDGTPLYGMEDHPHWGTRKFDFTQGHVRSFLLSCARYWMEEFHLDGLRTDGVASMIDLNFGHEGDSRRNDFGGTEDPAAISLVREINALLHTVNPGALLCAEDSSTYPGVTAPAESGGLGFDFKWDMGWMHDTLDYLAIPFPDRREHHRKLTFSMTYSFFERYLLSLSHDEVVHGKRSLIGRMPGTYDQQFAGMRLLMAWQMTHPGKKLTFMGSEFGQFIEWRFYEPLEWFLLDYPRHSELLAFHKELNGFYLENSECWEIDDSWEGFSWVQADNARDGVYAYTRQNRTGGLLLVLLNMSDRTYDSFPVGLRALWSFREVLNSDLYRFGGENRSNDGLLTAAPGETDGCPYTLRLKLPALTALILERCPSQAFRPWDRPERIGASIAYKAYL